MFNTILIPTDGSIHSGRAVEVASEIAEKFGATLIVLHVLAPARMSQTRIGNTEHVTQSTPTAASATDLRDHLKASDHSRGVAAEQSRQVRHAGGSEIVLQAEQIAQSKKVQKIIGKVHEGDPVETILREAEHEAVDLIVMGTRGLSDWKGILLGSVSHKVCQLADCPCVIAKAED
jgi:nucleotide-binding universal stress UspA family protein